MKLFNYLVLAYLLLIIADDFAIWCFNRCISKNIGKYDTEDLPKHVYRKVTRVQSAKRNTKNVIRVLQVLLILPITATLIVAIGIIIINY